MGHIRFMDRDDKLVWKKAPHGVYTPKLGYIALNIDLLQRQYSWTISIVDVDILNKRYLDNLKTIIFLFVILAPSIITTRT